MGEGEGARDAAPELQKQWLSRDKIVAGSFPGRFIFREVTVQQKVHTQFAGTYFDRDAVLRVERWARIIAWAILAAYIIEAGYSIYQTTSGAILGNYPIDPFSIFSLLARVLQGALLFSILNIAGRIMLILLDIEDNTRRAARK